MSKFSAAAACFCAFAACDGLGTSTSHQDGSISQVGGSSGAAGSLAGGAVGSGGLATGGAIATGGISSGTGGRTAGTGGSAGGGTPGTGGASLGTGGSTAASCTVPPDPVLSRKSSPRLKQPHGGSSSACRRGVSDRQPRQLPHCHLSDRPAS
jgi:hypothetical protein